MPATRAEAAAPKLRILATTDLHMHLTDHNYFTDKPEPAGGLTRLAPLIARARAEAEAGGAAVLLVDNGDVLQGTPMGDVAAAPFSDLDCDEDDAPPHPAMLAFARLGYDALGLGNHDFDFGLEALARVLAEAPCPVICSNLSVTPMPGRTAGPPFARHAIIGTTAQTDTGPVRVKIGLLSLLPPPTRTWTAHATEGRLEVGDIVAAGREVAAMLKAEGCDVVLALAHTGLGPAKVAPLMENAVIPLAALPDIDAIVAGHTHRYLPGPDHDGLPHVEAETGLVHGTPVVMPGSNGRALGIIDLALEPDATGAWQPLRAASRIVRVPPAPEGAETGDADLAAFLAPAHARTRQLMSRPVGHTAIPIHGYFSLFAPDSSLALIATSQIAALAPHLAGTEADGLPLLAAVSPARSGGLAGPLHYTEIPEGPILERHVADLCPFAEGISVLLLTGAELVLWLEQTASMFCRVAPGSQAAPLLDPAWAGHQFDVLHGLDYTIDLSAPPVFLADGTQTGPGRRVRLADPAAMEARFAVAVSGYRAAGGGNVAALKGARQIDVPRIGARTALRQSLAESDVTRAPAAATWRLDPMPGTTVLVRTGPGAAPYLPDLGPRLVRTDPVDADGFLPLTLALDT
ncbi:5'-nucleotidase C-terminal domain-containing protein [Chachezhania antarctica]|uniref:5'-nucleotidase C-terminal domain-containing protein n=1 Tax=Chachezhania antarctica TaxID=2340860 RepID=UPI0013CEFB8D|nr:5'-nucleotidase C-terminal domain-containing protein [Chachezhania antarctica]